MSYVERRQGITLDLGNLPDMVAGTICKEFSNGAEWKNNADEGMKATIKEDKMPMTNKPLPFDQNVHEARQRHPAKPQKSEAPLGLVAGWEKIIPSPT